MSTEVEQPTVAPVTDQPIQSETNGTTVVVPEPIAETAVPTTNGESKEEKKNGAVKKEPEPPKDPKTETTEWLNQQPVKAVHKANQFVLGWATRQAYAEDDAAKPVLPKSGFTTKREFVNFCKDGVILAHLANKLKPGSVETVKEGEEAKIKENQKANIDGFLNLAKEHVPEEQLFSHEDLEKGKEGYPKVFVTLFRLMLNAPEQFQHPEAEVDQFLTELSQIVSKNALQKLLDSLKNAGSAINLFVRRSLTRSTSNGQVSETAEQNGATTNGVHANGTITEPAHDENGTPNGTKLEEKKEEAPAIAAN